MDCAGRRGFTRSTYNDKPGAALYDADLGASGGTLRFAEFIHVEDDRIQSISLVYDPAEFRRLTAPSS